LGQTVVFFVAALITLSALFVKQHVIADVVAGVCWAFTAWSLAGSLYKFLIRKNIDPRTGLKQMLKKFAPIMFMFILVIFSMICFYSYR
jgi:membrane-associated phospholipid phosphatase